MNDQEGFQKGCLTELDDEGGRKPKKMQLLVQQLILFKKWKTAALKGKQTTLWIRESNEQNNKIIVWVYSSDSDSEWAIVDVG